MEKNGGVGVLSNRENECRSFGASRLPGESELRADNILSLYYKVNAEFSWELNGNI